MKSDAELLRDYRQRGNESAFRLLVERHSTLVHGAALRRTGDPELAREAAQQVFLLLAKNAGRLYAGTGVAGWLHRTAVLVSASNRRRELRRGRILKRYEDHVLLTAGPGGERWTEAVPLIDEGLTCLARKDRDILQAHFWQGLTYQQIAAASGSTEAAVQRRASRAFEKLGVWLGKHRAAVPAGILTAGLGTLTQPATGAPVATALAEQVLERLPRLTASSAWAWRVRETLAFGKMKFAAGFLTGAFVALLAGTGFAKGRAEAREEQARRRLALDVMEARNALRTLTDHAPAPAPPARRPLAEIVAEAADHYRNESDPAGAARGEILLEEILPEEVPAALALLGSSIGEDLIGMSMVPRLISRWRFAVTKDEAVVWVLENVRSAQAFRGCLQPAVSAWASKDAAAAREWWRSRTDLHHRADAFSIYHAILVSYSPERREALWGELPSLAEDERQAAENLLTPAVRNPEARQDIFSRISSVPDERIRASLLKRTGQTLAQVDPEAAVAWVRDLPLTDESDALMVRAEVAAKLMDRHPLLASRIMLRNPAGTMRDLWMAKFGGNLSGKSK
ncbi:MAG: polymerase, sigma-24 subunit, subfamily [Verrucomicrobiales bacterium]|nr:polymerase, sigma-24 subunit, subfamily [Verrucomicrobiales bacterium]